eukprot:m.55639 g.55639  ORF g.55639 m.55639 type:complete len:271 (-) comp22113_c1_seq3:1921-2733(-)
MANNIYMNADDIPALPPKNLKKSQEVVYEAASPPPKGGRTTYTEPSFAPPDTVVYADVDVMSKSKNKGHDEDVLYADISILEKRMANAHMNPKAVDAEDSVVYAEIVDLQQEAREAKTKKERKEKEKREKEERKAAPIPNLPDRAYKGKQQVVPPLNYVNDTVLLPQKAKAALQFGPGIINAHAKWYNAPSGVDVRVVLAHIPPKIIMYYEATGAEVHSWATNTLRGFGQKGKTFAFEAGRRSSTGEGFFKFMVDDDTDFQDSLKKNPKK